jgi:PAS domain S-box-containing protein
VDFHVGHTADSATLESLGIELERCQRELRECRARLDRLTRNPGANTDERLRETQAALEFVLQAARVGDWDLSLLGDTSRRSLRHDQCFGYTTPIPEGEWGVKEFMDHVHPLDRIRVESGLREAVRDLRDWESEFRVVWSDGTIHWLFARGSIYRTIEGNPARMLGIVMEITDRKRGEEALAASEQMARGQVEALKQTLDALGSESSPDRLAQHIARSLTVQLGAHSCSVWKRNESNGSIGFEFAFEDGAFVSKADSFIAGLSLGLPMDDRWPWPAAFREGKHCLIPDIAHVPPFALADRLIAIGVVTVLMVPMLLAGRLEGAIAIRFAHRRTFRADEIELAHTLANHSMLALQLTALATMNRDAAVMAERNRLARDIHDTLAQGFAGVIVQLDAAEDAKSRGLGAAVDEHLRRAGAVAQESLREARRSVQALRPHVLEKNDLSEALHIVVGKRTAGTGLRSNVTLRGMPRFLPPDWEDNLLCIVQEALTNALRHSQGARFSVLLAFDPDAVRLELSDDGCGFDPAHDTPGYGLLGMRERAEWMGGRADIRSVPGMGTTISITVPLANAAGSAAQ